jgi:very-short-patch-repair endonuclease
MAVIIQSTRESSKLLQESGYLVLRFLAEDVGKELDSVLDAILRSLSHRRVSPSTVHTLTISRRNPT